MADNVKPVHNNFQNAGTTSTTTTFYGFPGTSSRGFTNFQNAGSTSLTTTFSTSGYQYLLGTTIATGSEPIPVTDDLSTKISVHFDEPVSVYDDVFIGSRYPIEPVDLTDDLKTEIKVYFDEDTVSVYDQLDKVTSFDSFAPMSDTMVTNIKVFFTDGVPSLDVSALNPSDSLDAYAWFDFTDTTKISVTPEYKNIDSTVISIAGQEYGLDTTNIVVTPNNLVAVTNASSVSNPFSPTIIVNGVTLVTNPETAPAPSYIGSSTNYVNVDNPGIAGTSYCDLNGANLSLDYNGGSFEVLSTNPWIGSTYQTNLGQTVDVMGLTGTIVDWGRRISSSEKFYVTSGIFGTPELNKQFNIITYGNSQYFQFLTNQSNLYSVPPQNSFTTVGGMARAIADLCGITLSFMVPDAPYHDSLSQSGQTGIEALNTLASQVGATLRWNGSGHYSICYPDYHAGLFEVPNIDNLIDASGISYEYHLDLGLGVSGAGVMDLPVNTLFDPSTKDISNQSGISAPQVVQVGKISKLLTSDDPPVVFDLPQDYDKVYIQILVAPGQPTGGANQLGLQNFVTADPGQWFEFSDNSFASAYVFQTNVGGYFIPQCKIDSRVMPLNDAVQNGNFTLTVAVTKKSLEESYDKAFKDAQLAYRDLQARIQANVRFIQVYTGIINCTFFGALPLPGMWGRATYCGETVEGIIESVSFNAPDRISIRVAQYRRINILDRKLQYDLTSGNF